MVSPSTPLSDHDLGSLICCTPHWSLCEAVVNEDFEIVSPGTTNIQSHPPTFHHSALFQGREWAGFLMSLAPIQWYLAEI